MTKLGFIGDSNFDQYVTAAEQCGTLIGAALGVPVVIDGVSGSGAASVLARLPALMAQGTTHVVCMVGTNDMAGSCGAPLQAMLGPYIIAMGMIIDTIRAAGNVPIIWSPPAIEQPQECLRYPTMVAALRSLCLARGVAFFDLYEAMTRDACAMTANDWLLWYRPEPADLYHLSPTGHIRLATHFLRTQIIATATPPTPPAPPENSTVIFEQALESHFGNISGGTFKGSVVPTAPPHAVGQIRLTLKAHADEPLVLAKLHVCGQACGPVAVPQGSTLALPWQAYNWTPGTPIDWAGYSEAPGTSDKLAASQAFGTTWFKSGDYATQIGTTGFTAYSPYHSLVTKIEAAA